MEIGKRYEVTYRLELNRPAMAVLVGDYLGPLAAGERRGARMDVGLQEPLDIPWVASYRDSDAGLMVPIPLPCAPEPAPADEPQEQQGAWPVLEKMLQAASAAAEIGEVEAGQLILLATLVLSEGREACAVAAGSLSSLALAMGLARVVSGRKPLVPLSSDRLARVAEVKSRLGEALRRREGA